MTHEAARVAEKREHQEDPAAHVPVVAFGYQIPPLTESEDWFVLQDLLRLLSRGQASRLALEPGAGRGRRHQHRRRAERGFYSQYFLVRGGGGSRQGSGPGGKLALDEVDRIGREGVSAEDLERLRSEALLARATELVPTAARTHAAR